MSDVDRWLRDLPGLEELEREIEAGSKERDELVVEVGRIAARVLKLKQLRTALYGTVHAGTLPSAILECLRLAGGEAVRARDIRQHLADQGLPTTANRIQTELSRLLDRGLITRPMTGHYRLASPDEGPDSGPEAPEQEQVEGGQDG